MSLKKVVTLGAAAAMCVYAGSQSLFEVGPYRKAVLVDRKGRVKDKVYEAGTHFRLPWFERPVQYPFDMDVVVVLNCNEGKFEKMPLKIRVVAKPKPDHLPNLYRQIGDDYEQFMKGTVATVLIDVIAQKSGEQLFTEQEVLSVDIKKSLAERLDGYNITVDEVLVGPV